jgi:glycine dehydrogenase subunit 1
MRYHPLTQTNRVDMLKAIGVDSIDDLFAEIPPEAMLQGTLDLPRGKSELEVERFLASGLSQWNCG